ncbi:MAG: hypothetical protein WA913_07490, partial [Pricia sp.]
MERQLKLIWDFRGPAAAKTAEHHEKHLQDYAASHKINVGPGDGSDFDLIGHRDVSDMHSIA